MLVPHSFTKLSNEKISPAKIKTPDTGLGKVTRKANLCPDESLSASLRDAQEQWSMRDSQPVRVLRPGDGCMHEYVNM